MEEHITTVRERRDVGSELVADDRTPMEAAVHQLADEVARLEMLLREHAERLSPILHPVADEEGYLETAEPRTSERVAQVWALCRRVELTNGALHALTRRVEA